MKARVKVGTSVGVVRMVLLLQEEQLPDTSLTSAAGSMTSLSNSEDTMKLEGDEDPDFSLKTKHENQNRLKDDLSAANALTRSMISRLKLKLTFWVIVLGNSKSVRTDCTATNYIGNRSRKPIVNPQTTSAFRSYSVNTISS
jgi:hypothetical protein